MRHIIAEAGVNLAAVHYHFGSKEDLLDQLILRKAGPVNEERLAILDQLEAEAAEQPVAVEKILEAFLGPPLLQVNKSPNFVKLMGRIYAEGLMPLVVQKHFQGVAIRYFAALGKALPHLSAEELALRVRFLVGTMAHCMFAIPGNSLPGPPVPSDAPTLLRGLVSFLTGGLLAPPAMQPAMEEK